MADGLMVVAIQTSATGERSVAAANAFGAKPIATFLK